MTASPPDALPRNAANHQPLTPLGFLQWAAAVYPERAALLHGTDTAPGAWLAG